MVRKPRVVCVARGKTLTLCADAAVAPVRCCLAAGTNRDQSAVAVVRSMSRALTRVSANRGGRLWVGTSWGRVLLIGKCEAEIAILKGVRFLEFKGDRLSKTISPFKDVIFAEKSLNNTPAPLGGSP